MSDQKLTGSYYTPQELVEFMISYLVNKQQDFSCVLEPSAGDGRFLSLLLPRADRIDAIEIFEDKIIQINSCYKSSKLEAKKTDFIKYALEDDNRYSLIIGNPPYINIKSMEEKDIAIARELCNSQGLASAAMQNMWLAFVLGACKMLQPGGTIFFVLPMEFLQVQYAERLRGYLEKKFNTIHIISFQSSVFTDIEQKICLVYLSNRQQSLPYILYEIYDKPENGIIVTTNIIKKNKPLQKWSNAILSDDDILLLKSISSNYVSVNKIGSTAPGIVTGGNKYFILTSEQVQEFHCTQFVLPILQKSSFITTNTIKIDFDIFRRIDMNKKPVYLLNLSKVDEQALPAQLVSYLNWAGEQKNQDLELKKGFKCSNRKPWYGVPLVNIGDIIFFKRYDVLPRFYINEANIHTTDAGYHIRLLDGFDKDSMVFCFYNSMTLAQCEFNGRYYGGGVRELVPSEFKEINIPYRKIDRGSIDFLNQMFYEKTPTEQIVEFVNKKTIGLEFEKTIVSQLETIRCKLISQRRNRKSQL